MTRWFVLFAIAAIPALLMRQYFEDFLAPSGYGYRPYAGSYANTGGIIVFLVVFLLLLGIGGLVGKLRRRHA
jgi:hypothetical protein